MRVLLVDDEALALDRLRTLLSDVEDLTIVGEARDGDAALRMISETGPDLLILDIQMPGRNGLSLAAALPERGPEIVFITAHEHYAPDAFEVDAVDYILKPVRFERLRQAIDRARRRRALQDASQRAGALEAQLQAMQDRPVASPGQDFWAPGRDGQVRVPFEAVSWIEAARDYVLLHTALRSHMVRTTMAALEDRLAGTALVRVHRSAFVRMARVTELRRVSRAATLVLDDGSQVQVGPSYVAAVERALGLDRSAAEP